MGAASASISWESKDAVCRDVWLDKSRNPYLLPGFSPTASGNRAVAHKLPTTKGETGGDLPALRSPLAKEVAPSEGPWKAEALNHDSDSLSDSNEA